MSCPDYCVCAGCIVWHNLTPSLPARSPFRRYLSALNPTDPKIPEWPLWSFYAILSVFMIVLLSGGFFVVLCKANVRTN